MASKAAKSDPTVTSETVGPEYPEGTHPARPAEETTHGKPSAYKDNPDKPDPSTVAQVQVRPDEQ